MIYIFGGYDVRDKPIQASRNPKDWKPQSLN